MRTYQSQNNDDIPIIISNEYTLIKSINSVNNGSILKNICFFIRKTPKSSLFFIYEWGLANLTEMLSFRSFYSEPEIAYILLQIAKDLLFLRNSGIAHRNIKPDNIVITKLSNSQEFQYKIFDFSFAFSENLSNNKIFGLSKNYLSPEMLKNQENHENINFYKSDIYSLGVLGLNLMGCSTQTINSVKHLGRKASITQLFLKKYPEILLIILDFLNENHEKRCDYEEIIARLEVLTRKCPDEEIILNKIKEYKENVKKNESYYEKVMDNWNLINMYYNSFSNIDKSLEIAMETIDFIGELYKENKIQAEEIKKFRIQETWFFDYIGLFFKEKGDFQQSFKYYSQSLTLKSKIYEENNEEIVFTLKSLAEIQNILGNAIDSLELLERALKIHLVLYGENNLSTAYLYYNIGLCEKSIDNFTKAIENFETSLRIYEDLGENSLIRADLLTDLAEVYHSNKKYDKSIELLNSAYEIYLKFKCENHKNTARILILLGETYYSQEIFDKALENYEKALKIRIFLNGDNNENTLFCINKIAEIHRSYNDFEKAIEFNQKGLIISKEIYGEKSESYIASLQNIAEIYYKIGDLKKNQEIQEISLNLLQKYYSDNQKIIILTLRNLGEVSRSLEEWDKALIFFNKALEMQVDNSDEYAEILAKLASIYEIQEKYDSERICLEKAWKYWENQSFEGNAKIAVILNRMGSLYYMEGGLENLTKSVDYIAKALEMNKRCEGENDESNEVYINNLEMVTKSLNQL